MLDCSQWSQNVKTYIGVEVLGRSNVNSVNIYIVVRYFRKIVIECSNYE